MDWLLSFHPKCPFENQFPFLRSLLDLTINSLALYNYFFFFCVDNLFMLLEGVSETRKKTGHVGGQKGFNGRHDLSDFDKF